MDHYYVELDGETVQVELSGEGDSLRAVIDGREYQLCSQTVARDALSLKHGTDSYLVHLALESERSFVKLRGNQFRPRVFSDREWHLHNLTGPGVGGPAGDILRSPMPGKVLEIKVAVGDLVEPGSPLIILEAMKMENELKATHRARVASIHVNAGEPVEGDYNLITFESLDQHKVEA